MNLDKNILADMLSDEEMELHGFNKKKPARRSLGPRSNYDGDSDLFATDRRGLALHYPRWDSPHFDKPKTVYGRVKPGVAYVYSDRLAQEDYDRHIAAVQAAKASEKVERSADWYEVMLTHFLDRPVKLVHVMGGVNRSNGQNYYVFGFLDKG